MRPFGFGGKGRDLQGADWKPGQGNPIAESCRGSVVSCSGPPARRRIDARRARQEALSSGRYAVTVARRVLVAIEKSIPAQNLAASVICHPHFPFHAPRTTDGECRRSVDHHCKGGHKGSGWGLVGDQVVSVLRPQNLLQRSRQFILLRRIREERVAAPAAPDRGPAARSLDRRPAAQHSEHARSEHAGRHVRGAAAGEAGVAARPRA